MNITLSSF